MTLTIKIDDCKKKKIDRFIAKLILHEGKKVTIQEAVGAMIDHALEDEDKFMAHFKELPPIQEDPLYKMMENPKHLKINDLSTTIDEHLYGSQE